MGLFSLQTSSRPFGPGTQLSLLSWFGLLTGICLLAYAPFLALPLISDDYLQIHLGRQYGAPAGWADLASDALYRCRATSLLATNFIDTLFGISPIAHRLGNIVGHSLLCGLLLLVGRHPGIGWGVSLPAAAFFAIQEGHQEAVIWSAALPEVLVAIFILLTCLAAAQGMQKEDAAAKWYGLATVAFCLALASKESAVAVVGFLAVLVVALRPAKARLAWSWVGSLAMLSAAYAWFIFAEKNTHLHLNDGTFSVHATFLQTLLNSLWRMLLPWGLLALAALAFTQGWRRQQWLLLLWIPIAFLPYAFLTYMDRVPSRHTYLASIGLAFLVGEAVQAFAQWGRVRGWTTGQLRAAAVACCLVILAGNLGYLWTKKFDQYQRRANLTERFLQTVATQNQVAIRCGAYGTDVYRYAATLRLGWSADSVFPLEAPATTTFAKPEMQAANTNNTFVYCDPEMP